MEEHNEVVARREGTGDMKYAPPCGQGEDFVSLRS